MPGGDRDAFPDAQAGGPLTVAAPPGAGALVPGPVAVISTTVRSPAAGGEARGLELVDRLVTVLTGVGLIAVLPTDLLVRTGPDEFVIVCPAPAGQRRIMAVVDEIRATVLRHRDPGRRTPPAVSIGVAFAGRGPPVVEQRACAPEGGRRDLPDSHPPAVQRVTGD